VTLIESPSPKESKKNRHLKVPWLVRKVFVIFLLSKNPIEYNCEFIRFFLL
jgi:hypothetical protein